MSRKKVLWVSAEAWAAAFTRAKRSGESLTDAASRLLIMGHRRAGALAKHERSRRARREAEAR